MQRLSTTLVITFITVITTAVNMPMPSIAGPNNHDYFSRNTGNKQSLASVSIQNQNQIQTKVNTIRTAKDWFITFDQAVETHLPSSGERVVLSRPFNQDVKRVGEWTQVAQKVAYNYQQLANTIKYMPIPNNVPEIREYQNLTADWYKDVSQIFVDLIKPRAPARTMDELERQLKEIHDRSQNLVQTNNTLHMMDNDIRQKYDVPAALSNDPIRKYAQFKYED
jgi:hypothetical protein